MEFVFSFLPSYFSTIFFVKGKISKSGSLSLSNIGSKRCWPISLQEFKSNISLGKSDDIVYFFTCWYQKLRVDRKILGWAWSEMAVVALVTRWMDEWIDELSYFFTFWCKFKDIKNYFNIFWVAVVKNGHRTLILLNRWIWPIFCMPILFKKAKSYFNSYWVAWSNMGVFF